MSRAGFLDRPARRRPRVGVCPAPDVLASLFRQSLVGSLAFLLSFVAGVGLCQAHGGPPLRVGVTADPTVSAVARLVMVHLREGVGYAVDWRSFPDAAALRTAFAGGKIDIAIGLTEPGHLAPALPAGAECPRETLAALVERLHRSWGGGVYLLEAPVARDSCVRPALIVARAVLEDLRFGILGKESAKMAAFITPADVASVRAAAERGGERAATAAARAALAGKVKR
jgi:ABC-type nitrate/sulfonate/bicarbonate transport system substrate-binding protein